MIKIKSKQQGFRRCGMAHPAEVKSYPDSKFTPEQLARLQAEPMLIVEVVADKPAQDDIAAMTVAQLMEAIVLFQTAETLKGLKKADLVQILKDHQAAGSKE